MKNPLKQLCVTALLGLGLMVGYAQQATTASGGDASGSGGSVAYSVGQLVYTTNTGTTGSVAQGVQHAFDIYAVGIEDIVWGFSLSVFPNPTADQLTLSIENYPHEPLTYQLYDLQGKLLASQPIQAIETEIPFSHLPAAVYFLHVLQENQRVQSFKIVKH